MNLKRLLIKRLPGFESSPLRLDDLDPGLNVVLGPNGAGKSTAALAIQGLLWPEKLAGLPFPHIESFWRMAERDWLIEIKGELRLIEENGVAVPTPDLPPAHTADCFIITVTDLFAGRSPTDVALAERIQRDLTGGYSLPAVRELPQFGFSRRSAEHAARALQNAHREVLTIQHQYQRLRREEEEREELIRERDAWHAAQADLEQLSKIIELRELQQMQQVLELEFSNYPPLLANFRGTEADALAELKRRSDNNREELRSAEQRCHAAQAAVAATGWDPTVLTEEDLKGALKKLQQLQSSAVQLKGWLDAIRPKEAELKLLAGQLGGLSPEKLRQLKTPDLNMVEACYRQREQLLSRQAALDARLAVRPVAVQPELPLVELLNSGQSLLEQWLAHSGDNPVLTRRLKALSVLLSLLLGTALILLSQQHSTWYFYLLPIPALALVALYYFHTGAKRAAQVFSRSYQKLALPQPALWQRPAVLAVLEQLQGALAEQRRRELSREELRGWQQELDAVRSELQQCQRQQSDLAEGLAAPTAAGPLDLLQWARMLGDAIKLAQELCGLETSAAAAQASSRQLLADLNECFTRGGAAAADSAAPAELRLDQLQQRANTYHRAQSQMSAAQELRQRALKEAADLAQQELNFYQSLGLAAGDWPAFQAAWQLFPAYQEAQQRRRVLNARCEAAQQALPAGTEQWLKLSSAELKIEQEKLPQIKAELEQLSERIGRINQALAGARQSRKMEQVQQGAAAARRRLLELRQSALSCAGADVLLADIEKSFARQSRPALLQEADRLFQLFTNSRYRLKVTAAGAAQFLAYDHNQGRDLRIEQLSRGTRLQLLLAVRCANARLYEQAHQIPLILDEVLHSSDPERFAAIAAALLQLAREGRQIIYFSCRPEDAALWRRAGEAAKLPVTLLRLNAAAAVELLSSESRPTRPPPPQSGQNLADYVKLLPVPEFVSTQPEALHLAHLAADPQQLYRLLAIGIETFGQLQALQTATGDSALIRPADYAQIAARAAVIGAVYGVVNQARGRLLTPELLTDISGGTQQLQQLLEKAAECGWQVDPFLAAIDPVRGKEIRGLRRTLYEQIKTALEEEGYLSARPPLDPAALENQALAAAAPHLAAAELEPAQVRAIFAKYHTM